MKVAAPYTNDNRWKNIPDEYNIIYGKTSTLQKIIDFCELYPNKRINILFKDVEINFDNLKIINRLHKNIAIKLTINQLDAIAQLKQEKIKFFFDQTLSCSSLGLLDFMIKIKVSDIYLYDSLCYNIPLIKKRCEKEGIQIRLILNKILTFQPDANIDYKAPFFTPRDTTVLEKYIDTIEFDCFDDNHIYDWHKFNVFYKAWIINKDWLGLMSELIPEMKIDIPVYSLLPTYTERKISCGRKCSLNHSCNYCKQLIEIAQELWNKNIYIKNRAKK